MKAWTLYGINDLRLENVDIPKPLAGQALVRVTSVGICGSDIPRIYKTGASRHPLVPGHEFAGVVEAVGDASDSNLIGTRVGVFPLIPCGSCSQCSTGRYEMCLHYDYIGSRRDGAFAEYVIAPIWNLIAIPKEVTDAAAAMLEPMAVAAHAVRRMLPNLDKEKDHVAVIGLGSIGALVLMMLHRLGFKNLIAIGNKQLQRDTVLRIGISQDYFVDSKKEDVADRVRDLSGENGADAVFECVGTKDAYKEAIEITAPGARVMLVGNPAGDMMLPRDVYWKILRRQLTIFGTWNSSYRREQEDDWHYVLNMLTRGTENGILEPEIMITHRFALEDLEKGLSIMRNKSEEYLKVMIELDKCGL